jgi:hypothetical protein
MPRKLKDGQERKISVSVSVDPHTWAELETSCEKFRNWLRTKGVAEKDAAQFSRSALVRSSIEASSEPWFLEYMKSIAAKEYGFDNSQVEMNFPKD